MKAPLLEQLRDCLASVMQISKEEIPAFSLWRDTDDGPPCWELHLAQWLSTRRIVLEVVTIHRPSDHWHSSLLAFKHIRKGTDHEGHSCMALFCDDTLLLDPARIDQSRYPQSYFLLR